MQILELGAEGMGALVADLEHDQARHKAEEARRREQVAGGGEVELCLGKREQQSKHARKPQHLRDRLRRERTGERRQAGEECIGAQQRDAVIDIAVKQPRPEARRALTRVGLRLTAQAGLAELAQEGGEFRVGRAHQTMALQRMRRHGGRRARAQGLDQ